MKVYWQYSDKTPQCGDLKVLKDGSKFIRYFRIYSGMYVCSNGKNCYDWIPYDDERVKSYRDRIESGEIKYCKTHTKGRSIHIRITN